MIESRNQGSVELTLLSLTSAVYAIRRHIYRRYLIRVLSHGTIVGAHTSPLYINQYECLTVSPSAARHHVLVFRCLARQRASRDAALCFARLYFGVWGKLAEVQFPELLKLSYE